MTEIYEITQTDRKLIEDNNVLAILENSFCSSEEYVLILESNNVIYVFAFRLIKDQEKFDYLGKHSFTKEDGMTEKDIISKATEVRSPFDQEKALASIVNLHESYAGLKPSSVSLTQLGDEVRGSIVIINNDYLNRFLVATKSGSSSTSENSENSKYKVIEECQIEKIKSTHTETKVTVTGETSVLTNDIEKLIK